VALAHGLAPVEPEPAFAGPERESKPDESAPARQDVAGPVAAGMDTAPLALVAPDPVDADLRPGVDRVGSASPSPIGLGLATPASGTQHRAPAAEEPEHESTPEPGGLEP
jgi:hypothetical protein